MSQSLQNVNKKLELDRELLQILEQSNVTYVKKVLTEIVNQVKDVPARKLFTLPGYRVLHPICINLSATRKTFYFKGWLDLADKIGLHHKQIDAIEKTKFINESPAYTAIKTYSLLSGATLDKILTALFEIGRWDIVIESKDTIFEFIEAINDPGKFKYYKINVDVPLELNSLTEPQKSDKKKYDKIVLLTFTSESYEIARSTAKIFREDYNGKKIGVLLLHEHAELVNKNPDKIIRAFFNQSNYVLPILTTNYFEIINSLKNDRYGKISNTCLDTKYVNYIYSLMSANFEKKNCNNLMIRSIVIEGKHEEVFKHRAMENPLFRCWFYNNEIRHLAKRILDGHL